MHRFKSGPRLWKKLEGFRAFLRYTGFAAKKMLDKGHSALGIKREKKDEKRTHFQVVNTEERAPRAILVGLQTIQKNERFEAAMLELEKLAKACGIETILIETQKAATPTQATYIGKGKVEEIRNDAENLGADVVIFDQMLSPMQFRNLGKEFGIEVIDRTGLILRIFSEQAKTREAKLQVEHAHLQYVLPRLAGMWTHFGRQAGASGSMSNRGVGEKQIELDRRHIERRMAELEKELKEIDRERATQREKRLSSDIPRIALVGYTNAGKSTLLNRMLDDCEKKTPEDKKVLEQDKLFATLDTTVRKIEIKGRQPFLLSDTVGFINELPHSLVKAFRSTLEEVKYADLLLHVIDFSDPDYQVCMEVTEKTLKEIDAANVPAIRVFNKTDLVGEMSPRVSGDSIYMSAGGRIGFTELYDLIDEVLQRQCVTCVLKLPYTKGEILNRLQKNAVVEKVDYREDGIRIKARCRKAERNRLREYLIPEAE